MQHAAALLRSLPPTLADAPEADVEWSSSGLSRLGDAALAGAVAAAITAPKRDADTSFLTHAPLELAARAALLPMIAPAARDHARRRIASIAAQYARAGDEIDEPSLEFANAMQASDALSSAIGSGDPEIADAALVYLVPRMTGPQLGRVIAPVILPMLGAAAHAPILLGELPRLEKQIAGAALLLRAPIRMIAKAPGERLTWHQDRGAAPFAGDPRAELFARLAAAPPVRSASVYIAPTMLAVEAQGVAERLLGDVTAALSVDAAERMVLRVAALSMLQDDPASAPYGWTHALTMPQGVFAIADAVDDKIALIGIAATYALGFRATMGKARLTQEPPLRPRSPAYRDVAPIDAAGAVYHADGSLIPEIKTALAMRAAVHRDAHLAKYTLAAFDAAARDPGAARLYLAAAAYLGAWWDAHPDAGFE
ncbi:MAG: hypothetical protein ACKVS5_15855 [Parvularculaceae bacterium]